MEYREVVCRNCGHGMRIPEGASRIRCEYCDTEYFLSGADAKRREVRDIVFRDRDLCCGLIFRMGGITGLWRTTIPSLPWRQDALHWR